MRLRRNVLQVMTFDVSTITRTDKKQKLNCIQELSPSHLIMAQKDA